jgi:hypothetical protein
MTTKKVHIVNNLTNYPGYFILFLIGKVIPTHSNENVAIPKNEPILKKYKNFIEF